MNNKGLIIINSIILLIALSGIVFYILNLIDQEEPIVKDCPRNDCDIVSNSLNTNLATFDRTTSLDNGILEILNELPNFKVNSSIVRTKFSIQNLNVSDIITTNVSFGDITFNQNSTITINPTFTIDKSAFINNLTISELYMQNFTCVNLSVNNLITSNITSSFINNVNSTITNISSRLVSYTNATITNLNKNATLINNQFDNIQNITSLNYTNALITNNISIRNLSFNNLSCNNLKTNRFVSNFFQYKVENIDIKNFNDSNGYILSVPSETLLSASNLIFNNKTSSLLECNDGFISKIYGKDIQISKNICTNFTSTNDVSIDNSNFTNRLYSENISISNLKYGDLIFNNRNLTSVDSIKLVTNNVYNTVYSNYSCLNVGFVKQNINGVDMNICVYDEKINSDNSFFYNISTPNLGIRNYNNIRINVSNTVNLRTIVYYDIYLDSITTLFNPNNYIGNTKLIYFNKLNDRQQLSIIFRQRKINTDFNIRIYSNLYGIDNSSFHDILLDDTIKQNQSFICKNQNTFLLPFNMTIELRCVYVDELNKELIYFVIPYINNI